jgi:heme-degrading monooxygenase HmoA
MIARVWRGETTRENAESYYHHLTGNVMPKLHRIAGHRGAYVLRRDFDARVEFVVITLWESMQAVREFAGNTPDVAVVEPDARAVLADFDEFVRHYTVLKDLQ